MSFSVADLVGILDLEQLEDNIYRGRSPQVGWQRVFGGLVISQALVACSRTAPERPPHSLHGYFLLPGDPTTPIVYEVDRLRDGHSFATRRCTAIQHGRPIFTLAASFQTGEVGLDHAMPMPLVPMPDDLPSETELLRTYGARLPAAVRRYLERERPLELRPVDLTRYEADADVPAKPIQRIWMRMNGQLDDDPALHRAALAYLSDMTLLDTALVAHRRSIFEPDLQVASLDHALWFHRPFRADDWLLYAQDSPTSQGARGFTRGLIYAVDGTLVASVAQEGLIRER
ncbi:acyl-CoA thioesterase II [Lichenifustis flavocetrariae]|uniref:Acyl-CoA thioesterase 2 n=1 Tax=Lichenifustis flavocetrariae TaxID=2949735 RepID=A0AA41Z0X0_9HYPH|nr:acyl-CoA thioesterase II [Lichenifustis flavocetrariae]MCW6507257.1 acyl-CoA thioesterase II [Lichenifustis flavocetrariae]